MKTIIKPLGFWRHESFNKNTYFIVKRLSELDDAFKSFVLHTYNKSNFRGLCNSYKTLKAIASNKKMQILQKLHKISKPIMKKPNASSNKPASINEISPRQRLNNLLNHINSLPDSYFDSYIAWVTDEVMTPEIYKSFSESYNEYEKKEKEYKHLLHNYQVLCALNNMDKPKNLPIQCQFTV